MTDLVAADVAMAEAGTAGSRIGPLTMFASGSPDDDDVEPCDPLLPSMRTTVGVSLGGVAAWLAFSAAVLRLLSVS
eukprot:3216799-Rhodomonas_salina.5